MGLSLYDQVGSPSPSGWFGRKVWFLEVLGWGRGAGQAQGYQGKEQRARLGADEAEALLRAIALA